MCCLNSRIHDVRHVYWMGGSPCAGKSAVAQTLAEEWGWQIYQCDAHFDQHVRRAMPGTMLHRFSQMSWDEIWMRPVAQQVEEEIVAYREQFPLIVDDLLALDRSAPVLVEGCALLPALVQPYLVDATHAVWIVPTASFQRRLYAQRTWVAPILAACQEPEAAFDNWMNRDAVFARWITEQAQSLALPSLVIDGLHSIDDTVRFVRALYGVAMECKEDCHSGAHVYC